MESRHTPDALERLQAGHDAMRRLLAGARARATATPRGDAPAQLAPADHALKEVLPELRRQFDRLARLECGMLHPALERAGGDEAALGHARAGHEIHCRLLDEAEQLAREDPGVDGGEDGEGRYRHAFEALAERLLHHMDMVEELLFPMARRLDVDLVALGRRMARPPPAQDSPPAATCADDGRLDIGTGEDRSPKL
ncbi:MAG: hemerythrin domain-containing protein [Thauera sp.]|nr:hemerythrin domain-containing protein [Thauera sp.]